MERTVGTPRSRGAAPALEVLWEQRWEAGTRSGDATTGERLLVLAQILL